MEDLMKEYLNQSNDSIFSEHRDSHSDCDCDYGNGGHSEYDNHTDDDDDYSDSYD